MDFSIHVVVVSVVIALAVAGLTWSLGGIGGTAFTRYRAAFTERAQFNLREMFLFVDPGRLFVLNLALTALVGVLVWFATGRLVFALAICLAMSLAPRLVFQWMRSRRLQRIEAQLPDALLTMAGAMKAGLNVTGAIQQIVQESPAPLSQELDLMLREQRLGLALDESLENLARRVPVPAIVLMASAMRIALETGGGVAETLERAAATLRSQLAMQAKIRALTAQGKLQGWVVGLLPLLLLWVLHVLEPEATSQLWTTTLGYTTLAVIGLLELFGVILIRKIIAIDV